MLIITAVIIVLGAVCGIGLGIYIAMGSSGIDNINIDGSDFTAFFQLFGYITSVGVVIVALIYSAVIVAFLWAAYGIVLLLIKLYKKNRRVFAVAVVVLIAAPAAYIGVNAAAGYMPAEDGTIASIAYNHNPDSGYTVYIKENGEYTPYLVLDKNYMKTGNVLILRENIVGGREGYTEEYNGTIAKDIVYDGQMTFDDAKAFLEEEFPERFDNDFLNAVCDTRLEYYDVFHETQNTASLDKFFMLSGRELCYDAGNDGVKNNGSPLIYFKKNQKTAQNDIVADVIYWTRSEYYGHNCAVGFSDGWINDMDDYVKYGIRPAFAISGGTKIKRITDDALGDIYVFDIPRR